LQGADIVALGSWDNLVPYVWVTREKIADIRELRGKKVGAEFIEPGPLADLDRSGYIDRLYTGQDTKTR
jgi:hypothetical protein